MANTYCQLYVHVVFAVRGRESLIKQEWEERLYRYITGIVQQKGHKILVINGMPDHIHLFIGLNPSYSLSALVQETKKSSNKFIKENKFVKGKFNWQSGYGAFSYSHSQLDTVIAYITNQKEHHKKSTFKKEYHSFLKKFSVEYDEKYLFEWIE